MPTGIEAYTTYNSGWIVRIQPPQSALEKNQPASSPAVRRGDTRSLLLLHGWTGDETVMWIFTRAVPLEYWVFSPRAPVQAAEGGYGWLPREEGWAKLVDFQEVAGKLFNAFHRWANETHAPAEALDVMGFSQGAAMAYALAAYYPQQVNRVIALAGFLPADETTPGRYSALRGKKVYVAHGAKDETVPVQKARDAVRILQTAGSQVTYCESDVGHKLGANCLKGLESFLA